MSESSLPKVNGSRGGEDASRPSTNASTLEGDVKLPGISSARGSARNLNADASANGGGTEHKGGDKAESPEANESNEDDDDPIAVLGPTDSSQPAEKQPKKPLSKLRSRRGSQERSPFAPSSQFGRAKLGKAGSLPIHSRRLCTTHPALPSSANPTETECPLQDSTPRRRQL